MSKAQIIRMDDIRDSDRMNLRAVAECMGKSENAIRKMVQRKQIIPMSKNGSNRLWFTGIRVKEAIDRRNNPYKESYNGKSHRLNHQVNSRPCQTS